MPTLRDNLETFAQSFETARRRPDGESFVKLKGDAPDWIDMQAIHSALDAALPDDWIYAAASAVADDLIHYDVDDVDTREHVLGDAVREIADRQTDIYTADLARWYASASWAREITEEAEADLGDAGQTIEQRMQYGQFCAYQRIAYAILEQCEDAASNDDEG